MLIQALAVWLILTLVVGFSVQARPGHGGKPGPAISSLTLGTFGIYGNGECPAAKCVSSDTWFNTWADDDNIYVVSNDVLSNGGWNGAAGNSNVMFSQLSGYTSAMTGTLVNPMTAWGTVTQAGSDGANYKNATLASIRGTLIYGSVRQAYNTTPATQTNWFNTQFVKSTNHGTSWTPLPPSTANPYASPMFANPRFAMPSIIQNGLQDYSPLAVDRMDQFVYAMSADQSAGHYDSTYWQSGGSDQMFLGRVAVGAIANLVATDWTYYQGGDGNLDANWGAISTAAPVLTGPKTATGYAANASYLPAFQAYLMIVSYPTSPPTVLNSTVWNVFQAPHPWGPWSPIQSFAWSSANPQGPNSAYAFYFPTIVAKSVGPDGGKTLTLFTTGHPFVGGQYTLYTVPVTLQ